MTLLMMIAFTYLPAFVSAYFQDMPGVWKSHHRLILCWLIFMQAVHPGRKTLQEMARWTPLSITAWRFSRLLKATYWTQNRHPDDKKRVKSNPKEANITR